MTTDITRIFDLEEHQGRGQPPLVGYREVEPASRSLAPGPAFLFGPSTAFLARQVFGQIDIRAVGCYTIHDAGVAPTGVALKGQVAFSTLATHHSRRHVESVVDRVRRGDLPERRIDGPLVPLFGPAHDTYGHVLVDYLPKLWVLHQAGYDLAQLRFLVPNGLGDMPRTLLRQAGIGDDLCIPYAYGGEIIRTDRLVIPTIARTNERVSRCFGEATRFWTSRVQQATPRPAGVAPAAKVLLSRRRISGTRTLTNALALEAAAERQGFSIVCPETLPIEDQISLFEGASHVVGEYGSALHNTIFCKPGTCTMALRGTLNDPGFIQTSLAASLGQSTGYVFGVTEGGDRDQRFTVAPEHFASGLEALSLTRH
jgi:capsular polysaccharide biosynthesis protein